MVHKGFVAGLIFLRQGVTLQTIDSPPSQLRSKSLDTLHASCHVPCFLVFDVLEEAHLVGPDPISNVRSDPK